MKLIGAPSRKAHVSASVLEASALMARLLQFAEPCKAKPLVFLARPLQCAEPCKPRRLVLVRLLQLAEP